MSHRFPASLCLALFLLPLEVSGQTHSPAAHWTPPRTPDGHPDLQGVWTSATLTPLERPPELARTPVLTQAEAAAYERQLLQQGNRDRRDGSAATDVGRAYNEFWFDRGTQVVGSRRTSLIVDPADGRVPALTPAAQKSLDARRAYARLASRLFCAAGVSAGTLPSAGSTMSEVRRLPTT